MEILGFLYQVTQNLYFLIWKCLEKSDDSNHPAIFRKLHIF